MTRRFGESKEVPVSTLVLIQRINRELAKDDKRLCRAGRFGRLREDVGSYYILDLRRNFVVETQVDIEVLGRELGVLAYGRTRGRNW